MYGRCAKKRSGLTFCKHYINSKGWTGLTMASIEIDGISIEANDGSMLIEAADEAGIPIPRFCYHKKLSVAANCRMCLVDVEKAAKPLPACATPVTDGMKVHTRSTKAIEAQKGVMEFLLINHPLDCPICDQGGECDLQDLAVGYGTSHSRYHEQKRVVKDKDLGPLIATDMTRCIHCTRCVRFGDEVAGVKELGAVGRGEHMEIGTFVAKTVSSELSGNMIDLCPVGALTSKPFRYAARQWEMREAPGVSAHDCLGSNITIQTRAGRVMRVVPRENESINETWLSDRDRFSYEGLVSDDRLHQPKIKVSGQWQTVSWTEALAFAVKGLQGVVGKNGPESLASLVSPSATTEEAYLLQKLTRGLGSNSVDHRVRTLDFSNQEQMPLFPWLGQSIDNIENSEAILLVGSNVRKEQPILGARIRKAALMDAKIMVINPEDYPFNFKLTQSEIVDLAAMKDALAGVLKVLLQRSNKPVPDALKPLVSAVAVSKTHSAIANNLLEAPLSSVVLGCGAMSHPECSVLAGLATAISELSGATLGYLSHGANSAGASLAGALPHRIAGGGAVDKAGDNARSMFQGDKKGFVLLGVEPELDSIVAEAAQAKLREAEFVVSLSSYFTNDMAAYANVVLPIAVHTETSGTYVNVAGTWQSFEAAVKPLAEARPAWKVLRVMGNLLDLDGFDYVSSADVLNELKAVQSSEGVSSAWPVDALPQDSASDMSLYSEISPYAVDAVVRRAAALQATVDADACKTVVLPEASSLSA